MSNATAATGGARSGGGRALPVLAVAAAGALQLVVLVPFTVASGLLAPLWAMGVLYVLWFVAAFLLVYLARRRPLVTPLVPIVNATLLWALIGAGGLWLGWTP